MGRSASCFKIITCGSYSSGKDDVQVPESKDSIDKCGWSFRKRSARHRILSNTVTSEALSSASKERLESPDLNLQPTDALSAPEKTPVIQCTDEKPQLSIALESETPEPIVVSKDESEVDAYLKESDVITIQAVVRRFLAQRELLKLKNVVKLQAAVRGHLVRQHAMGTLRCIQAIVKMQALVRARYGHLLMERKHDKIVPSTLENDDSVSKPSASFISIEKLLSNRFARQLMESTPKSKPLYIKCDVVKQNSTWNWLERWMSVSSAELTPEPELTKQMEGLNEGNLASPVETEVIGEGSCNSANSKAVQKDNFLPSENEENLITYDADNFKFQACQPTASSVGHDPESTLPESSTCNVKETSEDINSQPNQTMQPEVDSHPVPNSLPHKLETEAEQLDLLKESTKRPPSEEQETEGKKLVCGSKKGSNPSSIATQTKFEELSTTANSNASSFHQDGVQPKTETVSIWVDSGTGTKELNISDNLAPHNLKVQYGGSECGTELSITSTLDSPDVSEGLVEYVHEDKISEQEMSNSNPGNSEDVDTGKSAIAIDPIPNLPASVPEQPKTLDARGESVNLIVKSDSPMTESKPELSASDSQRERESETGGPICMSSPGASPRSLVTVPESQGTPSSQLSVKPRKNRSDSNNGSTQKRKSLSAGKRSPSNSNHDSGPRKSLERQAKDEKNGKKLNSLGSTRPESSIEEAARDTNNSSSLPHFMQATESARAKVSANNSPRSSPDVTDREMVKKRHSLPGANGRQGSPRIQRSISQVQQGGKGNGGHIIHERKWQR